MDRNFEDELRKKYGIELGERIGRGAFGEVYQAADSGGACAVKISLDPIDISQAWVAQELKALELVKSKEIKGHPHIVTLFRVLRVQGRLVTCWELGQQSLADRLKKCQGLHGIPRDELLPYMEQAAQAIDFLNGRGIYHRDIKPENLILFPGDFVKLADLGLAKFVGASTGSHSGSGTLGYVPPEAHEDRLTKSSDLYALAATYIKLRTGHEPFGSNPMEIAKRQEAGRPILDGLDDREKDAVRHALAYKPEDRPQVAQTWVRPLTISSLSISVVRKHDKAEHPPDQPITTPVAKEPWWKRQPSVRRIFSNSMSPGIKLVFPGHEIEVRHRKRAFFRDYGAIIINGREVFRSAPGEQFPFRFEVREDDHQVQYEVEYRMVGKLGVFETHSMYCAIRRNGEMLYDDLPDWAHKVNSLYEDLPNTLFDG